MKRSDRETARILLEALETVRELRMYWQPKAGEVHRAKAALRRAGIPIPFPRRVKVKWYASEDELFASVRRRLARLRKSGAPAARANPITLDAIKAARANKATRTTLDDF
jgi:hypothetical protein